MPHIAVSISGEIFSFSRDPENGSLHLQWSTSLGSPIAAVHMMGKGNDIHKVHHVYLHQGPDPSSTPNVLALQDHHEVIFVGRNPTDGELFAVSNNGIQDIDFDVWGPLLASGSMGQNANSGTNQDKSSGRRHSSDSMELVIRDIIDVTPGSDEKTTGTDRALARLGGDEDLVSVRLSIDVGSDNRNGLPAPGENSEKAMIS
eukprot:CAMPEP_0184504214 /NCGR_PEP_ID=MMETSP0113_2-20130426/52343_1 /TAXON_ID=91329 /ORGANISM="Norrisiella sphaerica, Strain BC52" /LENGTH=201 /DNA_ID=CAMNT_0026893837 /DNA_START=673 /DNA_END=1275 /DNA_ORIENTATION=-